MKKSMLTTGIAAGLIVVAVAAYFLWPAPKSNAPPANNAMVDVALPDVLSTNARQGEIKFNANCAACHGTNAAGQDGVAPPLIHIIYEPNHHGDESFQRAAALGVRAHHWRFGDMPAVENVNRDDVAQIISYVRELQRANGIN